MQQRTDDKETWTMGSNGSKQHNAATKKVA